jgi:hypothetical protein
MKKKILISLLVVSFFNYISCYSYYTLTEEEIKAGRPYPEESIRLILNDESEIECYPPFVNENDITFYVKVDTLGRTLVGEGDITDEQTKKKSSFKGMIRGDLIDSSQTFIVDSDEYSVYWTKENKRLSFKQGEFIDFNPQEGLGYYVWESQRVNKKISFDEIKEIQESRINWYITGLIIVISAALYIWMLVKFDDSGEWEY